MTLARGTGSHWMLDVGCWMFGVLPFLVLSFATVSAQEKPAPPKTDPFVKEAAPPKVEPGEPTNLRLMTVLEIYSLPQSEAADILASESDHVKRYDLVRARLKDGKARFADVIAVATESDKRAVSESIGEFRYPTEFKPAAGEDIAWPTAFQKRNTGATFEFEPILSPDAQICDVNLVPTFVRFRDFASYHANGGAVAQMQPIFDTLHFTTTAGVRCNAAFQLGTLSPQEEPETAHEERSASLAFLTVIPVQAKAIEIHSGNMPTDVEIRVSFYSMTRETGLAAILKAGDSTAPFQAVKEALGNGAAKLEKILALATKSGLRAVSETNQELSYGTQFKYTTSDPAQDGGRVIAVSASAFETRNTGYTFEIEPVVGPDAATVNLNFVISRVIGRDYVWPETVRRWPVQPFFDTQKNMQAINVRAGEPTLFGTFNPAHDTGLPELPDSDRVWLGFIEATLVSP